jgi:uncharacterized membrane protein
VKRYVHVILLLAAAVWCLAIVAAPAFQLGSVYFFFSTICHQLPTRSWHIHQGQLGLCIRCSAISFGFLTGFLLLRTPKVRWLKYAIAITAGQWLLAVTLLDSEVLRALSGVLLGATAAPIVRRGVEEMFVNGVKTVHEPM